MKVDFLKNLSWSGATGSGLVSLRMPVERVGEMPRVERLQLQAASPASSDDLTPKESDYVRFKFRAISARYLGEEGYYLDFSRPGVLQASMPLMLPLSAGGTRRVHLKFHRNHSRRIEDVIGLVESNEWGDVTEKQSAPGINITVPIDIMLGPMEIRRLLSTPPLVDSVSKRYSMCGARIGAFVTRNKELLAAVLKFAQARLSPPTFGQIASEAALQAPRSYFEEVNREYRERRNILVEGLNSIPGVLCPMPKGAFYCVAELPIDDAEKFCVWLLEEFQHQGHTVMMAPAAGFYAHPAPGKKQVRLAYVLEQDKLRMAVECLRQALVQYAGTTAKAQAGGAVQA